MITALKNCFSSEEVNVGRQPELDKAKGFAILFMVWTHVCTELSPKSDGMLFLLVNDILGGPFAAPVFMVCLGIGICYSRNNSPKDLLKRGFGLLGIGLLLNVFRYVLPDLIKYALTNDRVYLDATFSLFSVDILQFAGLSFIFFALAKKFKMKNAALLFIGILASVLGMILQGISTGNYIIDQFVGFIWGTETQTYFPFLNWIIFPIAGVVFGSLLKRCRDKKNFYLRVSPICGGLMLIYLFFTIRYGLMFSSGGSYFFLGVFDAVFFIVLAIGVFGLDYAILSMFSKLSFKPFIRWSKNINSIYCIHWTLIGLLGVFQLYFGITTNMKFWQATLIAVIVMLVSDLLAAWYHDRLKPKFIK